MCKYASTVCALHLHTKSSNVPSLDFRISPLFPKWQIPAHNTWCNTHVHVVTTHTHHCKHDNTVAMSANWSLHTEPNHALNCTPQYHKSICGVCLLLMPLYYIHTVIEIAHANEWHVWWIHASHSVAKMHVTQNSFISSSSCAKTVAVHVKWVWHTLWCTDSAYVTWHYK